MVDPTALWTLGKTIGKGAFGYVHLATSVQDPKKQAAVKLLSIDEPEEVATIKKEVQILRACNHPNVVVFFNTYISGETMWLVMEYCGGGCVSDLLRFRPLKENEISVVLCQSLHGLSHLHDKNIIHRDFKSANLLLTRNGNIKVADFGVSKILENGSFKTKTFVGTPHWMSPEIIEGKEYDGRCDLWSVGIVGIELAEQNPPKYQINMHGVLAAIPKAPAPTLQEPTLWSSLFNEFLSFLLVKNPEQRATATKALTFPFLLNNIMQQRGKISLISLIDHACNCKVNNRMPPKPRRRAARQGNFSIQSSQSSSSKRNKTVEKETQDTRTDENDRLLGNWDTTMSRRMNGSTTSFASHLTSNTFATGYTTTTMTTSGVGGWSSLSDSKERRGGGRRRTSMSDSKKQQETKITMQVDELDVVLESANPFEVSNEINRTVDHDAMVLSEVIRAAALDIVEDEEGEEREEGAVGEAEGTEGEEGEDGTEWVDGQKEGEEQETTDRRKKIVGEYDLERMEQKGCCEEDVPNKKLEDMNDDDDDDDDEMWDRIVLQRVSIGFREVSSVRTDMLETSLEGTALVEQELVGTSDERSKITFDESVSSTDEDEDDDVTFMNQLIKKFGMEDVRGNTLCSWL